MDSIIIIKFCKTLHTSTLRKVRIIAAYDIEPSVSAQDLDERVFLNGTGDDLGLISKYCIASYANRINVQ